MKITLRTYVNNGNSLFRQLEHPAHFDTKDELMLAFRDCFHHHLGRRPSERQAEKPESLGWLAAHCGGLTYHFIMD